MKIFFDTSVLVAAMLENHPHHAPAAARLRDVVQREAEGCISTHGMAEFYAVLTRIPLTPPVYPAEAWQMIERNLLPHFQIAALSADDYKGVLADCARAGWTGGRIYDALHLAAARCARCDQICTLNVRHFRELAPDLSSLIRTP